MPAVRERPRARAGGAATAAPARAAGNARSEVVLVAPAAHQAGERGDAAADHEAGHGGADEDLLAVLVDLLAPVGDLGHLRPEAVDGEPEVGAVRLDRAPDLLRRAWAGHQRLASGDAGAWRAPTGPTAVPAGEAESVPLISCASSIASCGVGDEPFLTKRSARKPAIPPSSRISTPVMRKPTHRADVTSSTSLMPHDSAWSR